MRYPVIILLLLTALACRERDDKSSKTVWNTKEEAELSKVHNQLLDIEKRQGWKLLFDGKTLDGWHVFNAPQGDSAWEVREGTLYCNALDESKIQGDLVTDAVYENYELSLEWKISPRGNSGIFINVLEGPELGAAWQSGPEYQILEPGHMDQDVETKKSGCLYGFYPQKNEAITKSEGEWNHTKIIQNEGKVEFYLNGILTAEEDFTSSSWKDKVAASGFKDHKAFGSVTKGKIALQDWYFEVWFRNIKIREL